MLGALVLFPTVALAILLCDFRQVSSHWQGQYIAGKGKLGKVGVACGGEGHSGCGFCLSGRGSLLHVNNPVETAERQRKGNKVAKKGLLQFLILGLETLFNLRDFRFNLRSLLPRTYSLFRLQLRVELGNCSTLVWRLQRQLRTFH